MKIKQVTFTYSGETNFLKFWQENSLSKDGFQESIVMVEGKLETAIMEGRLPRIQVFQTDQTKREQYFNFIPSDYIVAYDYDKVEIEVCGNFKFNVQIEKTEVFYENLDEIKTKVNNLLRNELEALAGKYGKLKDEPFAECNVK